MQYGVVHTLVTPAGTLTFNQTSGDRLVLSGISGADGAAIRPVVEPLAQRDGAIVGNAYLGALYPVLEGQIVSSSATGRNTLEDQLRGHLSSILRADGTWQWTPAGGSARQRTVRLFQPPMLGNEPGVTLRSFQFGLICADPLAYSQTQTTSGLAGQGTAFTVTNGGTVETWPVLRVTGPATNPKVVNVTTGKTIELDASSYTVASGTYVDIDTRAETIVDSAGASQLSKMDMTVSTFWPLKSGANSVRLDATGTGAGTRLDASYRDAWL